MWDLRPTVLRIIIKLHFIQQIYMTNVERYTEGTNIALLTPCQRQRTADEGANHIVSRVLPHLHVLCEPQVNMFVYQIDSLERVLTALIDETAGEDGPLRCWISLVQQPPQMQHLKAVLKLIATVEDNNKRCFRT